MHKNCFFTKKIEKIKGIQLVFFNAILTIDLNIISKQLNVYYSLLIRLRISLDNKASVIKHSKISLSFYPHFHIKTFIH